MGKAVAEDGPRESIKLQVIFVLSIWVGIDLHKRSVHRRTLSLQELREYGILAYGQASSMRDLASASHRLMNIINSSPHR